MGCGASSDLVLQMEVCREGDQGELVGTNCIFTPKNWFNHQLVKIASILEAIFPVFCVLRVGNVQPLQINRMSPQKKRLFERRYKYLGGGFKDFFIFTRNPGEVIQFDEHIFRMCWSNHQLVYILPETNTEFTMKNRPKGKETNIGGTHFSLP